jgi:hypothetical protein
MTTIPKPLNCDQNWLDMKPTAGGRICGQCNKKIFDFTGMSWAQIEAIQKQNGNAACGMYNKRQLDNWGQDISSSSDTLRKVVAISGITVSISLNVYSQSNLTSDNLVISGAVFNKANGQPLPSARVTFRRLGSGTETDSDGSFQIVVKNIPEFPFPDTLDINCIGFKSRWISFEDIKSIRTGETDIQIEANMIFDSVSRGPDRPPIAYSVANPSLIGRFMWRIEKWFRKMKYS